MKKLLFTTSRGFVVFVQFMTFSPMAPQHLVGQDLLNVEVSRLHSGAPYSVGLLWASDQLVAETSTREHTTLKTDRHPCPLRDSKP
jgi:hypothetical protein